MSNAIKFSHPGGRIVLWAVPAPDGEVAIEVIDHGIGMPEALRASVLEITRRTTRPGTEGERGTGFGMPLVKAYVALYGGRISVTSRTRDESPDGHGTTIAVHLRQA